MAAICPACKGTETRLVRPVRAKASELCRIECAGCRRFVGWAEGNTGKEVIATKSAIPLPAGQPPAVPAPAPRDPTPAPRGTPPEAWLYVSKKLDAEWLPNAPLWAAAVVRLGERWFYRLTPDVVAWLEAAGPPLEAQVLAGKAGRDQADAYVAAMNEVWRFAREVFEPAELAEARAVRTPRLPEVPAIPAP